MSQTHRTTVTPQLLPALLAGKYDINHQGGQNHSDVRECCAPDEVLRLLRLLPPVLRGIMTGTPLGTQHELCRRTAQAIPRPSSPVHTYLAPRTNVSNPHCPLCLLSRPVPTCFSTTVFQREIYTFMPGWFGTCALARSSSAPALPANPRGLYHLHNTKHAAEFDRQDKLVNFPGGRKRRSSVILQKGGGQTLVLLSRKALWGTHPAS